MDEIKKFDVNDAMKSVKDKIKDAFVSLIPDEQWNEMVQKEIKDYFTDEREDSYRTSRSTKFARDVQSILTEEVKARVRAYLIDNFQTTWDQNGIPICNTKVEEFIKANSGKILSDMIGGTISMALNSAGYRMP